MSDNLQNSDRAVEKFFENKAATYREDARGPHGRLTDALIRTALDQTVLFRLRNNFSFLDAGGGTGRWTEYIATERLDGTGTLLDLTPGMLERADERAMRKGYGPRVRNLRGDVRAAADLFADESFDLILNSHHLLGFVSDPDQVIASLARKLTYDGIMVSLLPNKWHAAYSELLLGRVEQAERSLAGQEWMSGNAPYQSLFTPSEVRAMHAAAGLRVDFMAGFPCLVYPQQHQREGTLKADSRQEEMLANADVLKNVLRLESEMLIDPDATARGVSIFAVATRVGSVPPGSTG